MQKNILNIALLSRLLVATAVVMPAGCASFIANNTSQTVGTDTGERTIGQVVTDNAIERTAKINLYKLDPRFKQSRVNIDSFYGNVLLTGQVEDAALKQLAEDNLRAMGEVKTVHNYLMVAPQINYSAIMQDLAATGDAKARLMRAPVIRESKVKMHTENGVLYVMGRLTTAEIADLNDTLQQVSNVVKIVTLIDNLDTANGLATANTSITTNPVGLANQAVEPGIDYSPVAVAPTTTTPIATTPIATAPVTIIPLPQP